MRNYPHILLDQNKKIHQRNKDDKYVKKNMKNVQEYIKKRGKKKENLLYHILHIL